MSEEGSITLFPSAHISPEHIQEVRGKIDEGEYDIIAVELDDERFERAVNGSPPTPQQILQENDGLQGVFYAGLAFIQKYYAKKIGVEPGMSDMRAAIESAALDDTDVALIDRDINTTIKRFIDNITSIELLNQLSSVDEQTLENLTEATKNSNPLTGDVDFDEMTEEENIDEMLDSMRTLFPQFVDVFIDERDEYMAERLHKLRTDGNDVFAVIGAAHRPGIEKKLEELSGTEPTVEVKKRTVKPTK